MLRTTPLKTTRPATLRVFSLVLAVVAFCFFVLLVINAFKNGRPVAWQMLIIASLAETAFDTIANYYAREEDR